MLSALATLAVYLGTAAFLLFLARRFVLPVGRWPALVLVAAPLLFTGKAITTGGILAPLDIAYQAEPLHAFAEELGTARTVNPLLSDVASQMLPWRQTVREALRHGRLPLWNRHILSGEPLLGAAQPAVFHPGTWIGLLLPFREAWNFDLSLRLFLGLASAYLYFRGIAAGEVAALLGAFAWAFSDFLLFFVGYPITPSLATFPLLLLGLLRLVQVDDGEGSRRAVGLTVAALVLTAVAGHPETLFFTVAGGGICFLYELAAAPRGRRLRPVLLSLGAGVLALGLTAVVLFPIVEILPQTLQHFLRQNPEIFAPRFEAPRENLRRLVTSVVPYAFGALGRGQVVERLIVPAGYAGSLLVPFAAAGLVGRSRRRGLFLGLAALGFALNVRLPAIAVPLAKVPLFDIAINDYFVFLGIFGVSGLAVLGAERLCRGEGAGAFAAGAAAVSAAVAAIALTRSAGLRDLGIDAAFVRQRVLLQVAPPLAAALLVGVLARRSRLGVGAVALVVAVFVGARRLEAAEMYPTYATYSAEALYPPLAVLGPIPRDRPVRMVALHYSFSPNIASMYGLEDVRGYDAMASRLYSDTFPDWCIPMPAFYNRVDDPAAPMLAFLGARYVLVPPGWAAPEGWTVLAEQRGSRLVENPKALPRAFAPAHVAWVGDTDRARTVLATIQDFANDGVVGHARPGPLGWLPNGPAEISVSDYGPGRLGLSIESAAAVFVGTSVTAWKGWKLTLDGADAALLPFNHAFLGFQAPAGRHEAVLRYRPAGFVWGAAISGATSLGLVGWLLLLRRSRRRRGRAASTPA